MRKILFLIIVGVGVIHGAASVSASPLIFELSYEFSGATEPEGSTPWLTATFVDIAPNQVQLTMAAVGLTDKEFVSDWYFNFDPTIIDVGLSFTYPIEYGGSVPFTGGGFGQNSYKANGDSGDGFDIFFSFTTANNSDDRFIAGESAVVTFTGDTSYLGEDLTADFFNFLNEPEKGVGMFKAAAHVQGIGEKDEDSGWIAAADESISAIPEPGTILLIGAGLASLLGIRRFKFKK